MPDTGSAAADPRRAELTGEFCQDENHLVTEEMLVASG